MININIYYFFNKFFCCLLLLLIETIFYCLEDKLIIIPEMHYYNNNQILKLLTPSKQCKPFSPKTLFFVSKFRFNTSLNSSEIRIINYKNSRNSFVTYYMDDEEYFQYEELLSEQGIIRSHNIFGDNNFYLSKRIMKKLRNNRKLFKINSFIKYHSLPEISTFWKDKLYFNYLEMKKKYYQDYNFMPETFIYPRDKLIINKKFEKYNFKLNDLWFVKPTRKFGGRGISILHSLSDIKEKTFLITKYITNLDLIIIFFFLRGKKKNKNFNVFI